MFARLSLYLLVLAAATVAAASARASDAPPVNQPVDPCKVAKAAETVSFGADEHIVVMGDDYLPGWWQTPCGRFVVDINVPMGAATASTAFFVGGGHSSATPAWGESQHFFSAYADDCHSYTGDLRVYVKGSFDTQWKLIGGGTTHGEWAFWNRCLVVKDPGYVDVPKPLYPQLFGWTRYRVAVAASFYDTSWQPVSAWAARLEYDDERNEAR